MVERVSLAHPFFQPFVKVEEYFHSICRVENLLWLLCLKQGTSKDIVTVSVIGKSSHIIEYCSLYIPA